MACSSTPAIVIVGVVALGILYARNLEFMHAALHGGIAMPALPIPRLPSAYWTFSTSQLTKIIA